MGTLPDKTFANIETSNNIEKNAENEKAAQKKTAVTITVNGEKITAPAGKTILEICQHHQIFIPTLCHDPDLTPHGGCRLCVVEIKGRPLLFAACTTPAEEGMEIETESTAVIEARRVVLELLLANHQIDCLVCERTGSCKLQDYCYRYGVFSTPYKEGGRRVYPVNDPNPFIERNYNKCILCTRCIRACEEITGASALTLKNRGYSSKVAVPFDRDLARSACVFCGQCVMVCPVAALTSKLSAGRGRPYEVKKIITTCPYCGVGCTLELNVKENRAVGVTSCRDEAASPVNQGALCVKGRFGWDFIHREDRLKQPLLRKNGELVPASWEEALEYTASRLREIKSRWGPDSIMVLASGRATNEENYLIQKFARAVLGTNNVDHCARLCHAPTIAALARAFGSGAMTNSISDLEKESEVIFIIGSNTTETHPVIGMKIKRAVRRGARLIVADPRKIELARSAHLYLQHRPGSDVALLNGIMHVIVNQGLHNKSFIEQYTEGFETLQKNLEKYTPAYTAILTGVPPEKIIAAARLFTSAQKGAIIFAMGITQHTTGTDNALSIANLAMLTGNIGRPGCGVNPLRGQNNVQGASDMGALPDFFPGYQPVANPQVREKFASAWKCSLSEKPGFASTEAVEEAIQGRLKAMLIIGENPMLSDPDISRVHNALQKIEFLAVADIFLTETARLAHAVLPAACFAEKDGTFTNTERRVQRVRKAVPPPGEARADWEIICALASRLGCPMNYSSAEEIFEEMRHLNPLYAGMTYARLERKGLQWPCPEETHPGTAILHAGGFARGKGLFIPAEYRPPAELPDAEYPFILTTGRTLFHYHTGSMTRRCQALNSHYPEALVEMSRSQAEEMGIRPEEKVKVSTRRGSITAKVRLSSRLPENVLFLPFHFAEAAANLLTNAALDPVARIPEYKISAARVEKL